MMPIEALDIKLIAEADIDLLEKRFPEGETAKHTQRFLRQQKGEAVYLIAWYQAQPIGHALLKWNGSQDQHVTRNLQVACPDIEDLFVLAELRSQGIGSKLLSFAEQLSVEQGYPFIGLSVEAESDGPARRLYEGLATKMHILENIPNGESILTSMDNTTPGKNFAFT